MGRVSQEVLLQRAEREFLKGNYATALMAYGLILKDYPTLDEAKVGAYLSDLGEESGEEAQALFDYYQMIKRDKQNAVEIIHSLIDSLDTTKESIYEMLEAPMEEQVEYSDGIRYSDFLALVKSRGDFKKTFEDIMFSTKVVITDKDEFIDFVTKLADEGFDEMALGYLDATASLFGNDQEVLALYNVVQGMKK
jgi:tetratricopeptide (TPR) repeat protein